jgi:hypothetical protein
MPSRSLLIWYCESDPKLDPEPPDAPKDVASLLGEHAEEIPHQGEVHGIGIKRKRSEWFRRETDASGL